MHNFLIENWKYKVYLWNTVTFSLRLDNLKLQDYYFT